MYKPLWTEQNMSIHISSLNQSSSLSRSRNQETAFSLSSLTLRKTLQSPSLVLVSPENTCIRYMSCLPDTTEMMLKAA